MKPPWDRDWLKVTPRQFEEMVVEYLRRCGRPLKRFSVVHQGTVAGPEGEFELDALATFEALGAEFLVLVECKHHRNPIKRELVQVLADKLSSVNAQKGMLFSTAVFQKGAVTFATSRRIALVQFTQGGPMYETKMRSGPEGPSRPYDAYFVSASDEGAVSYHYGDYELVEAVLFGPNVD